MAEMVAGMRDVLEVMEAGESVEKCFRVHTLRPAELATNPPRRYTFAEIKTVREKLNARQVLLAKFLGVRSDDESNEHTV